MEIKVISADLDGAELRREKQSNSYHTRCDGKADNEQIQDAIDRAPKGKSWHVSDFLWTRIFGGK